MVYKLTGTSHAGKTLEEIGKLTTPSGVRRTLQEIRYKPSALTVTVYIYRGKDQLYELDSEINDYYKLPYPGNQTFSPGDELRLLATNTGSSDVNVKVEIVVDETTA